MTSVLQLSPAQLLDQQAQLRNRYSFPSRDLVSWMRGMAAFNANRERWQLMFYPYDPARDDEQATRFLRAIGRDLFTGRCYQVTRRMVKVLQDVFEQTLDGAEHVEPEELPSASGFIWFDVPLELIERTGGMISIRAMSWGPQAVYYKAPDFAEDGPAKLQEASKEGVRVVFWAMAGDPTDHPGILERQVPEIGMLQINHCMSFSFGMRFPKRVPGKIGDSALHYAHLAWILLGAEIASHQRARVKGSAQQRLRKSLKHDDVSVIILRRARPNPDEPKTPEHKLIDWKWRWFVQSFWRHIERYEMKHHTAVSDGDENGPHCVVCGSRVTLVREFIKGPKDKPLKVSGRQVYRLAR
jgi:hypothetical protein